MKPNDFRMHTSKDLYRNNTNPNYYEAYSPDEIDNVRTVLNEHDIEYQEVEHTGLSGAKSIRFYVESLNEEVDKKLAGL